jgi:predicted nuclease of predicted toxin-antitoxin system
MLRLAADENFRSAIVRGLRRRNPAIDIVRVQDAGLMSAEDPTVLEWAAQANRVLLTHRCHHHYSSRLRAPPLGTTDAWSVSGDPDSFRGTGH